MNMIESTTKTLYITAVLLATFAVYPTRASSSDLFFSGGNTVVMTNRGEVTTTAKNGAVALTDVASINIGKNSTARVNGGGSITLSNTGAVVTTAANGAYAHSSVASLTVSEPIMSVSAGELFSPLLSTLLK